MDVSLNISKITPPLFKRVLFRPRLIERLEEHQEKKLLLILGPAAQGKSTLAVTYASTLGIPAAWLNLGPEDADPVNLFYLLAHSLQRVLPEADLSFLFQYPAITMGPREELPLYRDWAQALFSQIASPVYIFLDGLDRLLPEAPAFRFLQMVLQHTPPHAHLVMLSREMPPLDLQELQLHQEAFILDGTELTFTPEETRQFFKKVRRFSLPVEQVRQLHQLTEGWIGGLVLLCEFLERTPASAWSATLLANLTETFKGESFQYFGDQIFSSRPAELQDFLVKSSILEVVEPGFMREFLGLENPQEFLQCLVRKNLFVQSIYDKKRGWLYRYHQLFRDFLRDKFRETVSPEGQQGVHSRAGALLEARGEWEEAVKHYLRAGAYPQAVDTIKKVGLLLLKLGRSRDLSHWLAALPPETVQADPWLLFFHYLCQRLGGEPNLIFSLIQASEKFEAAHDVRGSLLSLAYLIEASVTRGHPALPPFHDLLARGEQLVQSLEPGQYLPEQAALWFQLGFAQFIRGGNPRKGYRACLKAYSLAQDLGDIPLQISALTHAHGSLSALGEFDEAERLYHQEERLLEKFPHHELVALHLIFASHLYIWRGDLSLAGEMLQQARDKVEQHGLLYLSLPVMNYTQNLNNYLGKFEESIEVGRRLVNITSEVGHRFMHGNALLHLGLAVYFQGDLAQARNLLHQAQEILSSPEGRADGHLCLAKIIAALVAHHLHENGGAERDLLEAREHFRADDNPLFLKEAHLALALLKWQQGDTREATGHLKAGLTLMQKWQFQQHLLMSRDDLLQACLLSLKLGLEEVWDWVTHLLAIRLADLAEPELERLSRHPRKRVAAKAREVRRAIHRDRQPRVRLETLGGFQAWRGEVLLTEKDWGGRQPPLLLKALLSRARGPVKIPKDVLMEDLWPETDPKTAHQNFKFTLHRLRQALEPERNKSFGSSYLHLNANLLFLDQELCQVDVKEFLSLYQQGKAKEEEGDSKAALEAYQKARGLYRGDFLPEELYAPWVWERRQQLKNKYLDLLYAMARLYETRGVLTKAAECYRQVMSADLVAEEACQRLMLALSQLGRRNAALRVYQDYRGALEEINTIPDPATTSIYQKILEEIE